jgi:heme exporter protein A
MTLKEHLDLWASLYDGKLLIPAAVAFLRLEKELYTPCGQLSAGWQRRAALARLILAQTDIWLLDEPLNSLDDTSVEIILSLIATRCDQGGMVVMSYHGALKIPFGQILQMEDFICHPVA